MSFKGTKLTQKSRDKISKNHARLSGINNGRWSGGTFKHQRGYIYQYAPDHPNATKQGYVMQHRLVVEQKIGRFLNKSELVHHKNEIKDDNNIENLEIHTALSHTRLHLEGKKQDKAFIKRRIAAIDYSKRNTRNQYI